MNVWMQMHDLSHANLTDGSVEMAVRALDEFDWDSEILKEKEAASSGTEYCPPGIGFVSETGHILHIMPANNSRSHYHYHFPQTTKLLGFIPATTQETISVQHVSDEYRKEIIQRHYNDNHTGVVEMLNSYGKQWE